MAVETVHVSRPAALPSPRSPTISVIDMILPEGEAVETSSFGPHVERPPSPSSLYATPKASAQTIRLSAVPVARRGPSSTLQSPPISARASYSTLHRMSSSGVSAQAKVVHADGVASSPTVGDHILNPQSRGWESPITRKNESPSSSVSSDDLENIRKWSEFDGSQGLKIEGINAEEHESHDQLPVKLNGDADGTNDSWMNGQSTDETDEFASDQYSRRAEIILANAKKRLNVMEGNLRGARQSLVVSPSLPSSRIHYDLSHQISASRERDRRLYGGMGPIPPRTRPHQQYTSTSPNSAGHNRGLSETSVPLPFSSPNYLSRTPSNKRASSALGLGSGPWSAEGYGQGRFPIRESRSHEVMRDPRARVAEEDNPARSRSRGSRSPPSGLETLHEDSSPLRRSDSNRNSLRDQMKDLRVRISTLRSRAEEDTRRRQSLQILRTPSPFTSAQTWTSGEEEYDVNRSSVTTDGWNGLSTGSPVRQTSQAATDTRENGIAKQTRNGVVSPLPKTGAKTVQVREVSPDVTAGVEQHYNEVDETHDAASLPQDNWNTTNGQHNADEVEAENEFPSADDGGDEYEEDDDNETAESSVYEDAVYDMASTERHEDRLDAFDYENFFLHSAMGTYSSTRRSSDSAGSDDSVATTKAPPETPEVEQDTGATPRANKRESYHLRNHSSASISTIATFATAAEEQSDGEVNEQMDQFSKQILPNPGLMSAHAIPKHLATMRPDSEITIGRSNPSPTRSTHGDSKASNHSTTNSSPSGLYSFLLEAGQTSDNSNNSSQGLSKEEQDLLFKLATNLHSVCAKLQSTHSNEYDRKAWRRKLDKACHALDGEDDTEDVLF